MKINPKLIAKKHQVHFHPMYSSSSNTEGTVFLRVDNVQKKCKTSLTSF